MSVAAAWAELLAGREGEPLARQALVMAARLDDPGTSARDAVAVSRELRLLLVDLEGSGSRPVVESPDVFDLDSARRAREERRG